MLCNSVSNELVPDSSLHVILILQVSINASLPIGSRRNRTGFEAKFSQLIGLAIRRGPG